MKREHMRIRMRWLSCLLGLPLGFASMWLIGELKENLFGLMWANRADYFLMPGVVLAMFVSPGGVHGSSVELWFDAVVYGNYAFYVVAWCLVILLILRPWRPRSNAPSSP